MTREFTRGMTTGYHFFSQSGFFECLPASRRASPCDICSRASGSGQGSPTGFTSSSLRLSDRFFGTSRFSAMAISHAVLLKGNEAPGARFRSLVEDANSLAGFAGCTATMRFAGLKIQTSGAHLLSFAEGVDAS